MIQNFLILIYEIHTHPAYFLSDHIITYYKVIKQKFDTKSRIYATCKVFFYCLTVKFPGGIYEEILKMC